MSYRELSYREIIESFFKVNLLCLCILPFVLYFTEIKVVDYFYLMKLQFTAWFFPIIIALMYEKIRFTRQLGNSIYRSSLYVGIIISTLLFWLCTEFVFHTVERFEALMLSVVLFLAWTFYVFVTLKIQELCSFKWYIKLLDLKLSFKSIFQIFLLLNISFAFVIFLFILYNKKHSVLELLFILFYLEAAFFIFHIVIAKYVDVLWLNSPLKTQEVSLMGLTVASVIYVIKVKLVEERFFGIFEDVYIKDTKVLTLILTLVLCWIFFTLLFNFKIKARS